MADSKISALPASTTPLAGTEVLPIVQSSTTRQVSVANLTAGRAISATQLTLTTGNLIVASGQGIDFSATSGAPGATSELFNDYEEGTFTPTITFGGASVGVTYSTQNGIYTKIGNLVNVIANVRLTSKGSSVGTANLAGLPYSQRTLTDAEAAISIQANNFAATVITQVMGNVVSGSDTIIFGKFSAGAVVTMSDVDFANNTIVRVRVSYFI
jgi:hypothetical protein